MSIPLHFLKLIDFDESDDESSVNSSSQAVQLFLYVTFENMFLSVASPEKIALIFD